MSSADPYPPCNTGDPHPCRSLDPRYKQAWPEVVGKPVQLAKAIIEKDNPFVTADIVKPGTGVIIGDYCCNRVRVYEDKQGNVVAHHVPRIGN
ncbi:hypothetical protein ACLB2K_003676 [Fragaria x ananassa]